MEEPEELEEGGAREGLLFLILKREYIKLAKEIARTTPNLNNTGFIKSVFSSIIEYEERLI